MELITSKVFLRLVMNFLVIDMYSPIVSTSAETIRKEEILSIISPDADFAIHLHKYNSSQEQLDPKTASYSYCYGEENCTGNQYCHVETHQCQCYEYVDGYCPTVGMRCSTCCCGKNVYCSGEVCQIYEVDSVSSQMILSIVMVMGVVSIIFMVYRMCYRNSLQQRLMHSNGTIHRVSSRPSISSLQHGVMSRMRDRPPMYETRHNYQSRTGVNESENTAGVDNPALEVCEVITPRVFTQTTAQSSHPVNILLYAANTPPPPYLVRSNSNSDDRSAMASPRPSILRSEPPPYSVAIKEQSHISSSSSAGNYSSSVANFKELYI